MWTFESIVRHLLVDLVAGSIIFIVGLRWRLITSYLSRKRATFRQLFGAQAVEAGSITVTLDAYRDLRLLSVKVQKKLKVRSPQTVRPQSKRFFKRFPDGHLTAFPGPSGDILGYGSTRAAAYIVGSLGAVSGINVRLVSDVEVASQWDSTYINLGSSASNIKTDDVKYLPENTWLQNDMGEFEFKDGSKISIEDRADKGIVLKLANPYFPGHSAIVCGGLGEWGTSGAAWFLAKHWRMLSSRFGKIHFWWWSVLRPEAMNLPVRSALLERRLNIGVCAHGFVTGGELVRVRPLAAC